MIFSIKTEYYPYFAMLFMQLWGRLSWSEGEEVLLVLIEKILKLSKGLGCRLYDGQIEEYLTIELLEEIKCKFINTSCFVNKGLGKISAT